MLGAEGGIGRVGSAHQRNEIMLRIGRMNNAECRMSAMLNRRCRIRGGGIFAGGN